MSEKMKVPHTPGPWEAKPETNYVPAQVWADGRLLADVFGESRDAREANARLIAAAPTLLAAAKDALLLLQSVQEQEEHDPDAMPWPEIDSLEQAIREALCA
jgi:hypothetical protein